MAERGDILERYRAQSAEALAAIGRIEAAQLDGDLPTWVVRDLLPVKASLRQLEGAVDRAEKAEALLDEALGGPDGGPADAIWREGWLKRVRDHLRGR